MNGRNQKRHNNPNPVRDQLRKGVSTSQGSAPSNNKNSKFFSIAVVNVALTVAFVIFAFWLLAVKNGFMLRWYDEMSLFEPTSFTFREYLHFPGGLVMYAGLFMTQFMYHPFLGSAIIISLWLLIILLSRTSFGLKGSLYPFTLLLPISLLASVVQIDEAWLSMKSPGWVFSNTIGYLFTVATIFLYTKLKKLKWLGFTIAIFLVLSYFAAGYYAVIAAGVCIIDGVAAAVKRKRYLEIIFPAIITVLLIIIPRIYYTSYEGNTTDNDYLLIKGLPQLFFDSFDIYLWRPIIASLLCLLISEATSLFDFSKLRGKGVVQWILICPVIAGGIITVSASRKSEQLRATVLILQSIDKNEWGKAAGIYTLLQEQPNYSMIVLNNLVEVVLGGQWRDISRMSPSSIDPRHSEQFTMTAFIQVPVNYHLGRFNQSYRWAMEHTVQYGKRVFFLKYMVKDALLRGEYKLARRYNDILMHTMFHKKWAREMSQYIENPALIQENKEFSTALRMGYEAEMEEREESEVNDSNS